MDLNKKNTSITQSNKESSLLLQWQILFYSLPADILIWKYSDLNLNLKAFTKFLEISTGIALAYCLLYLTKNHWSPYLSGHKKIVASLKNKERQVKLFIAVIVVISLVGFLISSFMEKTKFLQILIPISVAFSTISSLRKAGKNKSATKEVPAGLDQLGLHFFTARWISISGALLAPFYSNNIEYFISCFLLSFVLLLSFEKVTTQPLP